MKSKPTNATDRKTAKWLIVALGIVLLVGSVGVGVFLGLRSSRSKVDTVAWTAAAVVPASGSSVKSFEDLADIHVAGRYRITDGADVMFIVLNEDHTFINKDGTTYPPYRWDVLPDRLVITWQRSSSTFTSFERLGVYSSKKSDGSIMRMEKLPDLPPADAIAISDKDVIASMNFTASNEINGLTPVNIEGDGAIFPGDAGGQECRHLVRSRSRMSAYLYVRIAPELKTEPFTNALVVVEYFDGPARDARNGWVSLQYDARDGPYTSTAQRVRLTGSLKWTRAAFVLDAPVFSGRESDGADFRLCVANPDLSVRAIKLVKNRPVQRFLSTPRAAAKG